MKNSYTKPVLIFALIIFLIGIIFAAIANAKGGNYFRASSNIDRLISDNAVIKFEFSTPVPTEAPRSDYYDIFGGSDLEDIFDIFEEFGLDDDILSPYGGGYDTAPGAPGKIY